MDPRSKSVGVNRNTLSWNAAATAFAYTWGRLALEGYLYVEPDQLVGGVYLDNEPAVSCLDWQTREPNAKYYAIQMLAEAFGSGKKSFFHSA